MRLLRPFGLSAVFFALSLVACGESKRGPVKVQPAEKDGEEKDRGEKDEKREKGKFLDLPGLHAEVTVLQVFHALDLSAAQLKLFADVAEKTMQDAPARREVKVGEDYRKAMLALRAALREGDDKKVEEASAALDDAREKDDPIYDEIEITDGARKHAPALFEKLSSRQVVFYLSGLVDAFPDPAELMQEALEEARKLDGKEWRNYRDDIAFEVGWLVAGLDAKKEGKVRDRATALLDKAHDLEEKAYDEQKAQLEKSALELIGKLGPLDVVRHYVERVLAETLSNHKLAAAVEGKQKKK